MKWLPRLPREIIAIAKSVYAKLIKKSRYLSVFSTKICAEKANRNSLWYELHGNYYLPRLAIPEEEIRTIGIWGRKHFSKQRKRRCP